MRPTRQPMKSQLSREELGERLRAHRFRLTPQRAAVFRGVCQLGHASPRQIHEVVRQTHPMLSMNTVYTTLETLERVGQVLRLTGPEGNTMYEAAAPMHHHFHCLRCRRIVDIHDPTLNSIPLPPDAWKQFTVTTRRVEFYGYCPGCRRRLGSAASSQQPPPAQPKLAKNERSIRARGRTTRSGRR